MEHKINYVRVETAQKWVTLKRNEEEQNIFSFEDISVAVDEGTGEITLRGQNQAICRIQIGWDNTFSADTKFLGDAFERAYGDLRFESLNPDKLYFWYVCGTNGQQTSCWGVKVQPKALCSWSLSPESIDLWLDIRNGSHPLKLKQRDYSVATLVFSDYQCPPYQALCFYCEKLAIEPKMIPTAIFGCNDWYFAYGNNSWALIEENAKFIKSVAPKNSDIKPWMVIDDGWQVNHRPDYNGGPWNQANNKFQDMKKMADKIKQLGVRPGIWFRPLLTTEDVPKEWILTQNKTEKVLDISHPEVLDKICEDIRRLTAWGYELIKHDFSTYDIFGLWGKDMDLQYQNKPLAFFDKEKSTAEILLNFYRALRSAAGETLLMGCNTISHLSANLFEIMRTGDDTSGRNFDRTRKMGVNTLAFRMPQHRSFYLCDADCIGITSYIPWHENKKWLDLLANSGTPLFISCDPKILKQEQIEDIKAAIHQAVAATDLIVQPQDIENIYPEKWIFGQKEKNYSWYETPRTFFLKH